MVDEAGTDVTGEPVEPDAPDIDAAARCNLSLSFCDMYSNTERGAAGRGVSPSTAPRYGRRVRNARNGVQE
jgi:hypothetical protein